MVRTAVAALLCWLLLIAAAYAAGGRVALVIGNADYANAGRLANPLNDADDLAAALTAAGYEVTKATDLDAAGMRATLKSFRAAARGAEIAMVFYAGHGLEVDNKNYLVPVDATLESDSDVIYDTIPLDLLTEAVSGAKTLSLVILDACRNNPFAARFAGSSRSIGRGLSFVEPAAGTLVAYSARDGTIASDGDGERNSPFTTALLRYIAEPGLALNLMFRKVRDEVMAATGNVQEPFVYGSLPGRAIYLVPPVDIASTETTLPGPATEQEEFAWSLVKDTNDIARLDDFIDAFPRGAHIAEAIARLRALSGPVSTGVALDQPTTDEPPLVVSGLPDPQPLQPTLTPLGEDPGRTTVADVAPVQPVLEIDERQLAQLLQVELNRIGCAVGSPDGIWGRRSKAALAIFARETSRDVAALTLTPALLDLLKTQTGRVCPVVCSVREDLVGDQCVLKTCPAGQRLSSKGACYVPVAANPAPKQQPANQGTPSKSNGLPVYNKGFDQDAIPQTLCSLCN